jgi:2-oxoglutarate ferredoxin oxidoreductase subunit alpha
MNHHALNVLIGGEAGQGLVTLGQILGKIFVRSGYSLVVTQDYMSRIRGGHNTYALRVSPEPIQAPQEKVDLLIALDRETPERHREELTSRGVMLADSELGVKDRNCVNVPLKEMASEKFMNVASLGVASEILGLDRQVVKQTLTDMFGKHPGLIEENQKALEAGFAWGEKKAGGKLRLPSSPGPSRRLVMNGNEAIALGALTAGLKFFSFYPMTPSTSIGQALAGWARKTGIVVEQGEDEIAVINMALGASFAGAPSMVATSGGGFALMVEGISLAAMTETPIVVVVAQRPGPATGLPTRTEQADLEFVLHAGHGEFPRAVFAPGNIEQCFELTQKALHVAETYQSPVFLLTDQFLADSYRSVEPFSLDRRPSVQPWKGTEEKIPTPYRRYELVEKGISRRLLPGASKHLVVADSDEHDESGHITEDLSLRRRMVEKRLRKEKGILSETVSPQYLGDEDPNLLLVCWGSSQGSAMEALETLREQGKSTALLHFSQVWPLVPDQFLGRLEKAKRVVAVESNAFRQMARLIRRETGFRIQDHVNRYDGLPLTPEFIVRNLPES